MTYKFEDLEKQDNKENWIRQWRPSVAIKSHDNVHNEIYIIGFAKHDFISINEPGCWRDSSENQQYPKLVAADE